MPAGSRAALVLVLALALPVGATLAGSPGGAAPAQVSTPQPNTTTTIVVQIQPDGDARWTISTGFPLTTANETTAFRDLAAEFESGQTSALGLDAYRQANALANRTTAREMAITNVRRTSSSEAAIENGTGRLALSFTWTNFGRVEGDRIHIGDAFETPDGTWFPGLERGQTLVVRAPERYSVFDANVPPQNGTLRWTGPESFGPDTLEATFTGGKASVTPTPSQPSEGGLGTWLLVGVAGIVAGALVVYLFTRRDGDLGSLPTPRRPGDDTDGGDDTEETEPADSEDGTSPAASTDEGDEPAEETEKSVAEADEASSTELDGESGADEDDTPTELLSDEERVERLLTQNGGRMKQATIVKETGWSNAKVSQLLSSMAEDGRIDKLRIGRENLISFPDEDITEFED